MGVQEFALRQAQYGVQPPPNARLQMGASFGYASRSTEAQKPHSQRSNLKTKYQAKGVILASIDALKDEQNGLAENEVTKSWNIQN